MNVIDTETLYEWKQFYTWELPIGAKCKVHYKRQTPEWEEEWDTIATFDWMDWGYWRWLSEDWKLMIFNGLHELQWDMYNLVKEK